MDEIKGCGKKGSETWKILSSVDFTEMMNQLDESINAEIDIKCGISREKLLEVVGDYDGIIASDVLEYDAEVFEAAKNLKIITRFGVGMDNVNVEDAERYGVMAGNVPGENARSVAEHTLGLIVAACKNFPESDREMRKGNWERSLGFGQEITGRTLGQIGFGNIGKLVARKMKLGFDMDLLVYDPYVPRFMIENEGGEKMELEELLEKSDVVTVNAPLTEDTQGLLGMEEFRKMKNTAILVNAGRGGIVKEDELAEALKNDIIFAAGLDVMENEPPEANNPIFELSHVVVTPHCASATTATSERVFRAAIEEQMRACRGEKPLFLKTKN